LITTTTTTTTTIFSYSFIKNSFIGALNSRNFRQLDINGDEYRSITFNRYFIINWQHADTDKTGDLNIFIIIHHIW